ncbi:MAG: hypothetical protein AB7V42_12210 [Thermoleophilia bacterium]
MTSNPLPAHFHIEPADAGSVTAIVRALEGSPGIDRELGIAAVP